MKNGFYNSKGYIVLNIVAIVVIIISQVLNGYEIINKTTTIVIDGAIFLILAPLFAHMYWLAWRHKKLKQKMFN